LGTIILNVSLEVGVHLKTPPDFFQGAFFLSKILSTLCRQNGRFLPYFAEILTKLGNCFLGNNFLILKGIF